LERAEPQAATKFVQKPCRQKSKP